MNSKIIFTALLLVIALSNLSTALELELTNGNITFDGYIYGGACSYYDPYMPDCSRDTTSTQMQAGEQWYNDIAAWAFIEFNTSSIPEDAIIDEINLTLTVVDNDNLDSNGYIKKFINQPSITYGTDNYENNTEIYDEIYNNDAYLSGVNWNTRGTYTYSLGQQAIDDLDSHRDWFAVGLQDTGIHDYNAHFNTSEAASGKPVLKISYHTDTTAPTVNLKSPGNDTNTTSYTVTFVYNVSDDGLVKNCSLYINNTLNQTDTSITKNTDQTFTQTFETGSYSWYVSCTNGAGLTNQSETRYFTVPPYASCVGDTETGIWTISSNTVINSNVTCKIINITNNAVVTINNTATGAIIKLEAENITVEAGSVINATGKGYAGGSAGNDGSGPGGGGAGQPYTGGGGGAGYGGTGGSGSGSGNTAGSGGTTYGDEISPTDLGSGGGGSSTYYEGPASGGRGGGAILLEAKNIILNGNIYANGLNGQSNKYGGGGGSGGSVFIIANTISGTSTIEANGGNGGSGSSYGAGGGGAGGRIYIIYNVSTLSATLSANGGTGGSSSFGSGQAGQDGTIGLYDQDDNSLTIYSGWQFAGNYVYNNLTISSASNLNTTSLTVINVTDMTKITSSTWNYANNVNTTINTADLILTDSIIITTPESFFKLYVNNPFNITSTTINGNLFINTSNLTIDSSSLINATGKGYAGGSAGNDGSGPGGGGAGQPYTGGGGGAGYGGTGGSGSGAGGSGGTTYGDEISPTDLGSGGGGSSTYYEGPASGGRGGGSVIIFGDDVTINANIYANGLNGQSNGYGGGGGSGGSIFINVTRLSGTSTIEANGGNGGSGSSYGAGGGGAGGRISLQCITPSFLAYSNVNGGTGGSSSFGSGQAGQDGTLIDTCTGIKSVNLISPPNNAYTNTQETFTCNATTGNVTSLTNLTLYIWNSTDDLVYTNTTSVGGIYNETSWNYTLPYEDIFKWNCKAMDNVSNERFASANYTITYDATYPLIDYAPNSDANGTSRYEKYIFVNVTVTETNEQNITFNLYNSTGLYRSNFSTTGLRSVNWTNLPNGQYWLNVTVCDKAGNCNTTETRTVTILNYAPSITRLLDTDDSITLSEPTFAGSGVNVTINNNNITLQGGAGGGSEDLADGKLVSQVDSGDADGTGCPYGCQYFPCGLDKATDNDLSTAADVYDDNGDGVTGWQIQLDENTTISTVNVYFLYSGEPCWMRDFSTFEVQVYDYSTSSWITPSGWSGSYAYATWFNFTDGTITSDKVRVYSSSASGCGMALGEIEIYAGGSGYKPSGYYLSPILDANVTKYWDKAIWNYDKPAGTDISLSVRAKGPKIFNFTYRKPITINSNSSLTDYQINLTIDTQTLISQGKMQEDCDDIRFTDSAGNKLNYYLESGCNTSSTKIWVKVPSISAGTTTIFMYYGNPEAESESNETATFDFFDDFNGDTKFTNISQPYGDPNVCGSPNYVEHYNTGTEQVIKLGCYDEGELRISPSLPASTYLIILKWRTGNDPYQYDDASNTNYDDQYGASTLTPKRLIVVNNGVVYEKDGKLTSYSENTSITITGTIGTVYLSVGSAGSEQPYYTYYDYMIIRKYASSEPTYTLGEEETGTFYFLNWTSWQTFTTSSADLSGLTGRYLQYKVEFATYSRTECLLSC